MDGNQGPFGENHDSFFKSWGRSERSLACFACCQEFYLIFTFPVHSVSFKKNPLSSFS